MYSTESTAMSPDGGRAFQLLQAESRVEVPKIAPSEA